MKIGMKVLAFVGMLIGGRYLLRPVFRFIAASGVREVFTAATLLLVLGSALFMDALGLSMALGTFIAGVLLAESEYRHELETAIDPFKGLLRLSIPSKACCSVCSLSLSACRSISGCFIPICCG